MFSFGIQGCISGNLRLKLTIFRIFYLTGQIIFTDYQNIILLSVSFIIFLLFESSASLRLRGDPVCFFRTPTARLTSYSDSISPLWAYLCVSVHLVLSFIISLLTASSASFILRPDLICFFRTDYLVCLHLVYNSILIYIYIELPKLCYHPRWRLMRLGYRTCFHTLYDENLNTKTLWKDKVTLQKVGVTSLKDRNFNKYG